MTDDTRPVSETYSESRRILDSVAAKFTSCYGGEFEDARADADNLFMDAYRTHVFGPASFGHWLRLKVWRGLQEVMRTRMARNNRLRRTALDMEGVVDHTAKPFNLSDFLEGHRDLSADAVAVVTLVLYPPMDVRVLLNERTGVHPGRYGIAIRQFLKDQGWSSERVVVTFEELGKAF